MSTVYETAPQGRTDQPTFLNMAVLIHTELSAAQIKDTIISRIEKELVRQRTSDPNAPRTIDLDIVLYNEDVLDYRSADGRLRHLPDPDLLYFAHVAVPVSELVPEMQHPETGEGLATIARRLTATPEIATAVQPRPDITLTQS
jgi:2-amino-4-hydroxy-6-hydroxymethyldihydropteridine diphosphokinase